MKKVTLLSLLFPLLTSSALANSYGFEQEVPSLFQQKGKGKLQLSSLYYKEGASSLEWSWKETGSFLEVNDSIGFLNSVKKKNNGIMLWIYNETPSVNPLTFYFKTADDKPVYSFSFGLNYAGWRACWMKYEDMDALTSDKALSANIVKMSVHPSDKEKKGRIFLDRFTISSKKINDQVTPDAQLPHNNRSLSRTLWHWCRIWEWEQYKSDVQPVEISEEAVALLEKRINDFVNKKARNPEAALKKATNKYKNFKIRTEKGVSKGNPLVVNDEINKKAAEVSLTDVNEMLFGFAADWYMHANEESKTRFFEVFAYAINQGFAYGSCMGSNHHYGYQIREIYEACWMMRDYLSENKEIHRAITFWSGLQETRLPYEKGRDELLDSWNTLLFPRLISAFLFEDKQDRNVALLGLSRWVSGSLAFTPGTIGGIKPDGTTFHHGGFYPAYSVGAFSTIGNYVELTKGTPFEISTAAKNNLKLVLSAMQSYTSNKEWSNGICGRHPFHGELTAGIMRLYETLFGLKYEAAETPQGFFSYNHGAFGVHRRDNWMVSLKGHNAHVWNSEIYAKDNRYGRYQGYGAVEILNADKGDRKQNCFVEDGWDWNRIPGTTTIHLPIEELESPLPGTLMVRSGDTFSGSSALEGKHGLFAIALQERDYRNFTADFTARKSVFCFDNRLICLGSDISNSNSKYGTETTLFQNWLPTNPEKQLVQVLKSKTGKEVVVDMNGNCYQLPAGQPLQVAGQMQQSRQNKTKKKTS
ncbi:MAG: chondroitinase family polysaccharide lyase, partial [Bacteroidales bacterium]